MRTKTFRGGFRDGGILVGTIDIGANIVNDDPRTTLGEKFGVSEAKAATSPEECKHYFKAAGYDTE